MSVFLHLPTELQCSIISYLDPITLISVSQACRQLRRLIHPQRVHFVERLLALETLDEYGGDVTSIRQQDPHTSSRLADAVDAWWDLSFWACTSCLRLLPSKSFASQYIDEMPYQKPLRGNRNAYAMLASWSPIARPSGEGLDNDDENENDGDQASEPYNRASRRHLRRCVECCFQRGEFLLPRSGIENIGTGNVPMIFMREMGFPTHIDRCFPGFSDALEKNRPDVDLPIPDHFRYLKAPWSMYIIRCPGCSSWKEMRDFRICPLFTSRLPMGRPANWDGGRMMDRFINKSLCSTCFVEKKSREELAKDLRTWYRFCIEHQLHAITWFVATSWSSFYDSLRVSHLPKTCVDEYRTLVLRTGVQGKRNWGSISIRQYEDVVMAKSCLNKLRDIVDRAKTASHKAEEVERKYELLERALTDGELFWRWLMACRTDVDENPDLLVEWALDRDGTSLS